MMMIIIKSLLILSVISGVSAWLFTSTAIGFAKVFVAATIIQIIIWNIYSKFAQAYAQKIQNEFTLAKIAEYSKQGTEVTCPCGKGEKAFIPIRFDRVNTYTCFECKRPVIVAVETKTYLQTEVFDNNDTAMQFQYEKARKELANVARK